MRSSCKLRCRTWWLTVQQSRSTSTSKVSKQGNSSPPGVNLATRVTRSRPPRWGTNRAPLINLLSSHSCHMRQAQIQRCRTTFRTRHSRSAASRLPLLRTWQCHTWAFILTIQLIIPTLPLHSLEFQILLARVRRSTAQVVHPSIGDLCNRTTTKSCSMGARWWTIKTQITSFTRLIPKAIWIIIYEHYKF